MRGEFVASRVAEAGRGAPIRLDPYRAIVFPNAMRDLRRRAGCATLISLASALPEIPYIRLSKIERGEVFAKPHELRRIAGALGAEPHDLLLDVELPSFSIAAWAAEVHDPARLDRGSEELAVMIAAALRLRRMQDKGLTVAAINDEFGIPPVILSRLENAQKPLDRWNEATQAGLCRLFGASGTAALRRIIRMQYEAGDLNPFLGLVSDPEARAARTRERIAELREELSGASPEPALRAPSAPAGAVRPAAARLLPVLGSPLPDGLISPAATGDVAEAPRRAGPRAFALRTFRQTLGPGLPAGAVLIADPDRFPSAGDLALIREGEAWRLVFVTVDREGAMKGCSRNPEKEIALDAIDPAEIAAVIGASFI
jgi:hypothetical protein